MTSINQVRQRFQLDADDISLRFIKAYGLKFTQDVGTLKSPLLRWLDFRYRYIDPQPRQVITSDRFPISGLPRKAERGLIRFVDLIRSGQDINPYQSKGLMSKNDTSGKARASRTDLMWADWSIHHFHLSDTPLQPGQKFSERSSHQVFCIVGGDVVALIDVLPHAHAEGYSNLGLMETIKRNWPEYLDQFKLKGITPGAQLTSKEISEFRRNGVNSPLTFNGSVYMSPGMGITTASTPLRLTMAMGYISRSLDGLAQVVLDPADLFQKTMAQHGINAPLFKLEITERGLCVYEEKSTIAFLLPHENSNGDRSFLTDLSEFLAPDWAVRSLLRH